MKKTYLILTKLPSILIFFILTNSNAQFFELGDNLIPTGSNQDGTIIVGINASTSRNFIWTEADGVTIIPDGSLNIAVISEDGTTIFGSTENPTTNSIEMSSYDITSQTWTNLGGLDLGSDDVISISYDLSDDGVTAVGLAITEDGFGRAISWTSTDGIIDLGTTVTNRSSRADVVNSDGTIIGGYQDAMSGFRQAAIWTNGTQEVLFHGNGEPASGVIAMSSDGVWAGGAPGYGNDFKAWKWSQSTGIIDIESPEDNDWRGILVGLSEDGARSIGSYSPPAMILSGKGFIHTDATGLVDLTDLAIAEGNNLNSQILARPGGISDDGLTTFGRTNTNNGFVLRLPAQILSLNDFAITDFTYYPNPVKNELFINSTQSINSLKVYSIIGEKLMETKPNSTSTQIKIDHLSNGIYFIEIKINEKSKTFKIIKNEG